jgi:hypothetical protein
LKALEGTDEYLNYVLDSGLAFCNGLQTELWIFKEEIVKEKSKRKFFKFAKPEMKNSNNQFRLLEPESVTSQLSSEQPSPQSLEPSMKKSKVSGRRAKQLLSESTRRRKKKQKTKSSVEFEQVLAYQLKRGGIVEACIKDLVGVSSLNQNY